MDFKRLFIQIAVIGLLTFSIMSFVIITQADNNPSQLITNNTVINSTYGNLVTSLSNTQTGATQASNTFGAITPSQSSGGLIDVTAVVSPTRSFQGIILGVYNVLIQLPMKILGVSPIVASVIDGILLLLIIIGIWAVWKGVVWP